MAPVLSDRLWTFRSEHFTYHFSEHLNYHNTVLGNFTYHLYIPNEIYPTYMSREIILAHVNQMGNVRGLLQMQFGNGHMDDGLQVMWRQQMFNLMLKADAWQGELVEIHKSILGAL